jgi:hypothetical protein
LHPAVNLDPCVNSGTDLSQSVEHRRRPREERLTSMEDGPNAIEAMRFSVLGDAPGHDRDKPA